MQKSLLVYSCAANISFVETPSRIEVYRDSAVVAMDEDLAVLVSICAALPNACLEDLASALSMRTNTLAPSNKVMLMLDTLIAQKILQEKRIDKPISKSPHLTHHCTGCGCSCQAQLVGPLSEEELAHINEARQGLSDTWPQGLNPIMKGMRPDGSCLHFLNFPQKCCTFLNENNLCRIHAKFGAQKKPAACRRYPYAIIETEAEFRLAIKPYCYKAHLSFGVTPEPDNEPGEALIEDLRQTSSFRPVLRTATALELEQARLQELLLLRWLSEPLTYAQWMAQVLQTRQDAALSMNFVRCVQDKLRNMATALSPTLQADKQSTHIAHCLELLQATLSVKLPKLDSLKLSTAQWAYAQHCLLNAVYLRETSRFPSLNSGTLALSLGVWLAAACAKDEAGFYRHFTAYMRIMAQTQAFTMLFASPHDMDELIEEANASN